MKEKSDINRIRNSGGHTTVGTEDEGAIMEMNNIAGRLLVIKERAIYEIVMADSIDPERTNANLPPMIQKIIIDRGTESEIVSRTLLTAIGLFKPEYIVTTVDCNIIISLMIDMLSEIYILEKEISEYQQSENDASAEYEIRKQEKAPYKLPSVVNLESRCKTIFQKADHVEQLLMGIITRVYPDLKLTKQSHFPNLHQEIKKLYHENDGFVKLLETANDFMQVLRELRNGFDHRLDHTKAIDYELQVNGDIISPTIELNHKKIKLDRTSLSEFLKLVVDNLIYLVEMVLVYLASKNLRNTAIPNYVKKIPVEKRQNKFVSFSIWSPIGEGGYFSQ